MAKSGLGNLVPLIILFVVLAVLAAVGFVAYSIANDVGHKTRQKMDKRNISFTKEGMKVGVKEVTVEQQQDSAQNVFVKIWNQSSFPTKAGSNSSSTDANKRQAYSRSSSSQKPVSQTIPSQSTK